MGYKELIFGMIAAHSNISATNTDQPDHSRGEEGRGERVQEGNQLASLD